MISVHRTKPQMSVDGRRVKLSEAEHLLMVTIGMMDNRLIPADVLIEFGLQNPVKIQNDRNVLSQKLLRLKRKANKDFIKHIPFLGYRLTDAVEFVG